MVVGREHRRQQAGDQQDQQDRKTEDGRLVLFEAEEQIGCLESSPGSVHFLPAIRMVGFTSP